MSRKVTDIQKKMSTVNTALQNNDCISTVKNNAYIKIMIFAQHLTTVSTAKLCLWTLFIPAPRAIMNSNIPSAFYCLRVVSFQDLKYWPQFLHIVNTIVSEGLGRREV